MSNFDLTGIELDRDEVIEAHQRGEDAYMNAITELGREFNHDDMTRCVEFFIEAVKNAKFIALHS